MAGTIPLSMTQQLDQFGAPLAGGHLYLIQAGTVSTPQNGFQDSALTLPWPNPIILSASGRIPQFFLADGSIKIRLTDVNGVEILVADGLIVTGASSGGGGGSPVDATTVLATGDIKVRYGIGILTGFVRCNARTIGSATSGGSERANADAQALFEYLWNTDANLTVSTGRGASSIADWGANKNIALPDWRGRALAALDDMGNSAAGRLTATYFGTAATVLGAAGGAESQTLTSAQIPAHTHTVTVTDPGHVHTSNAGNSTGGGASYSGASGSTIINFGPFSGIVNSGTTGVTAAANANVGGGGAHPIASPMLLATVYLKL
jgi:microcystin-dependent protein